MGYFYFLLTFEMKAFLTTISSEYIQIVNQFHLQIKCGGTILAAEWEVQQQTPLGE